MLIPLLKTPLPLCLPFFPSAHSAHPIYPVSHHGIDFLGRLLACGAPFDNQSLQLRVAGRGLDFEGLGGGIELGSDLGELVE